jgi:hypothetical protein
LTLWHREHLLSGASEAPLLLPHAAHASACDAAAVASTFPRPAAVRSACSAATFRARAVFQLPQHLRRLMVTALDTELEWSRSSSRQCIYLRAELLQHLDRPDVPVVCRVMQGRPSSHILR